MLRFVSGPVRRRRLAGGCCCRSIAASSPTPTREAKPRKTRREDEVERGGAARTVSFMRFKEKSPLKASKHFFQEPKFFSLRINLVFLPKYLAQMSLGPFLYILMSSYLSFIEIKCSPCTAVCSVLKALSQTRVRIQRIQLFS